ncbi:MAG: hypothetical protein ISN29_02430 [Gammaproteobacteria bacterium AqS3]|nr:hypothetical protein [Gammaproteobacteria bacterium AqS3]
MNIITRGTKEDHVNNVESMLAWATEVFGEDHYYTDQMRNVVEFWKSVDESEFDPLTEEEVKRQVSGLVVGYVFEMKRMKGINPYYGKKRTGIAPDMAMGLPAIENDQL